MRGLGGKLSRVVHGNERVCHRHPITGTWESHGYNLVSAQYMFQFNPDAVGGLNLTKTK